jgi:hypothetical protein
MGTKEFIDAAVKCLRGGPRQCEEGEREILAGAQREPAKVRAFLRAFLQLSGADAEDFRAFGRYMLERLDCPTLHCSKTVAEWLDPDGGLRRSGLMKARE